MNIKLLNIFVAISVLLASITSRAFEQNDAEYIQLFDNIITSIKILEEDDAIKENVEYINSMLSEAGCDNFNRIKNDIQKQDLQILTISFLKQEINTLLESCNITSQRKHKDTDSEKSINNANSSQNSFKGIYENLKNENNSNIPFKLLTSNDTYEYLGTTFSFSSYMDELKENIKKTGKNKVISFNEIIDHISGQSCLFVASVYHNLVESGPELREKISDKQIKILVRVRNEIFRNCKSPNDKFMPND